jgi:hypothetical protein
MTVLLSEIIAEKICSIVGDHCRVAAVSHYQGDARLYVRQMSRDVQSRFNEIVSMNRSGNLACRPSKYHGCVRKSVTAAREP